MNKPNIPTQVLPSKNFLVTLKAFFKSKPMRIISKIFVFIFICMVTVFCNSKKETQKSMFATEPHDNTEYQDL